MKTDQTNARRVARGSDQGTTEALTGTLTEELVAHLTRQSRWMALPTSSGALLIFAIAFDATRTVWPAVWLLAVVSLLFCRFFMFNVIAKRKAISEDALLSMSVLFGALNGLSQGMAVVFFPFLMEFERFIVSIVIFAFCAGAVGSTAGYPRLFFVYIVPALLPLSIVWAINPGGDSDWRDFFVATLIVFFGGVLTVLARDAFGLFRKYIEINERLSKSDEAKTRFLAAASHDLRQPVQALTIYSGILADSDLGDEEANIASHIEKSVDALRIELEQLLNISRLDAGVVRHSLQAVRLKPILDRLKNQFAPLAQQKKLKFDIYCAGDPTVITDAPSIEQILRNLLGNAIKFTDAGSVTLKIEPEDDSHHVTLTDTGCGIPGKDKERIFEEFYQAANPSRDRSQGFGLGLAITKRLFELLDVEWDMQSTPGIGTTFEIWLPTASERATESPSAEAAILPAGLSVLVIDDDPEVLAATKKQLEAFGCRVSAVDRALAALTAVAGERPDVVLCDLRLGGEDTGTETIQLLREKYPGLPAILMTGDTAPDRLNQIQESGLTTLHKPFRREHLAAAIASVCSEAGEEEPRIEK
jgi:signal transduction histidine kinase/CheY-like chemotaxis protein